MYMYVTSLVRLHIEGFTIQLYCHTVHHSVVLPYSSPFSCTAIQFTIQLYCHTVHHSDSLPYSSPFSCTAIQFTIQIHCHTVHHSVSNCVLLPPPIQRYMYADIRCWWSCLPQTRHRDRQTPVCCSGALK